MLKTAVYSLLVMAVHIAQRVRDRSADRVTADDENVDLEALYAQRDRNSTTHLFVCFAVCPGANSPIPMVTLGRAEAQKELIRLPDRCARESLAFMKIRERPTAFIYCVSA